MSGPGLNLLDFRACHLFTQTLHSEYVGWNEFLKLLIGFNHPDVKATEAQRVKACLERINQWREAMWAGRFLVRGDASSEAPEELDEALLMFDDLQRKYLDVETILLKTTELDPSYDSRPRAVYVVAAIAWRILAYDDSIMLAGKAADFCGHKELGDQAHHESVFHGDKIEHLNEYRSHMRHPDKLTKDLITDLLSQIPALIKAYHFEAYNALIFAQGIRRRIAVLSSRTPASKD